MKVGWSSIEEIENIERFGVSFRAASEVVRNSTSLKVRNLYQDFFYIGPTNDLSTVLAVNCKIEGRFRKIYWARKATFREGNSYFNHLAEGGLK